MDASPSKENILKKIRQALSNPVPLPFPASEGQGNVYQQPGEELAIIFAREFTGLQGRFAFCLHEQDLQQQVQELITSRQWTKIYCCEDQWSTSFSNTSNLSLCDASITGCEYLVARTGTIVMSAAQQSGRTVSVYAPVHICIAYTNQLVYDNRDSLQLIKDKYGEKLPSLITFASGPSRTADIEKTLVTGVHGPREVYLFLVESAV
jgi:L-lactate dehydrogenase complex protein LldG